MAANFQNLTAAIDAAVAQATKTVGTEASAGVIIAAQGTATADAVKAALEADDAADQGSIDAAVAAVNNVTKTFADSDAQLGAAIAANPGSGGSTPPVA